jgi:hypothetical protein
LRPTWFGPDGSTVLSHAFKLRGKPDPNISVDLARLTTPEETAARGPKPGFGVGRLVAGEVRALGLAVRHDPIEGNPANALIEGAMTRLHCHLLAQATTVVLLPRRPEQA